MSASRASVANLHVGDEITLDAPADGYCAGDPETRTVAAIDGNTAVLDAPLQRAHDSGVWVENSRSGTSALDTQGRSGTAMWEQWDPGCTTVAPCTGSQVSQRANESFSHGWGSAGIVEMLQTLLGITITSPGAATLRIEPPDGALTHAAGTQWTERGPVHVSWTQTPSGTSINVDIRVNVSAVVVLDGHQYNVGSGHTHLD